MEEYSVFTVTDKEGNEVELALVDEFEFEDRTYVVGALIVDDTISEDGVYIYRAKMVEDDFEAVKITSPVEYKRVCRAYEEMED